jgi:hypothetical protein
VRRHQVEDRVADRHADARLVLVVAQVEDADREVLNGNSGAVGRLDPGASPASWLRSTRRRSQEAERREVADRLVEGAGAERSQPGPPGLDEARASRR